jgi:Uncharacterised nucleotidyltransferase
VSDPRPQYDPNEPAAVECYHRALRALVDADVEFLVGGAYALARYAGIVRDTKDIDLFLRARDRDRALAALAAAGFQTEVTYTHWLAKAVCGEYFIDLIYNSGNGSGPVDDGWFRHAVPGHVVSESVRLCPAEECLWSKAFIMERHRYDGADIHHILRAHGHLLDWPRLLHRFGDHWRVLYGHLVLFGFAYPADRERVPAWVMRELTARVQLEIDQPPRADRVCQGTLLAAMAYLPAIEEWGYRDARVAPEGRLTPQQVTEWTDGVRSGR